MRSVPLIVNDINVMVSGATISQSPSSQIMQLWRHEVIDIAVSPPMMQRMEQVFGYPRVRKLTGWTEADVQAFLSDVRGTAIVTAGTTKVSPTTDPEDNLVFACAVEANADYIVSGDKRHVLPVRAFQGIPVVTPREFLNIFEALKQAA